MAADRNQQKLIQFLDRRVWSPVLKASPSDYPEADRKRLDRLKRKTETQRARYHDYASAGQVRQEFQDDLSSQAAKRVSAELEELGLPTQREVASELFALADRLGVSAERGERRPHPPHPPHPWHKSTPEAREEAKRELISRARKGDEAAIETLRAAPRKWARDLAAELTSVRGAPRTRRAA